MLLTVAGLLAALLIIDLVIHIVSVRLISHILEVAPSFQVDSAFPDPDAEEFECTTEDGLRISGCLLGRPEMESTGVVLFFPEMGGSRWSASNYCAGLIQSGLDVVAIDFRNQGDSSTDECCEPLHWLTEREERDIRAVLDWVSQHPRLSHLPRFAMGVSRGATAALCAGAIDPQIRGIVSDSGFTIKTMMPHFTRKWARLFFPEAFLACIPDAHIRLTLQISRWFSQRKRGAKYSSVEKSWDNPARRIPLLLISGSKDTYVPVNVAEQIQAWWGTNCSLWTVPGAKHNRARQCDPEAYDRYVTDWILARIDPPSEFREEEVAVVPARG